jgi:hypothetical protein
VPAKESGWIRTNPEAFAVESIEATGEPNRETNGEADGTFQIQSEERSGSFAARGLPAFLKVHNGGWVTKFLE